MLIPPEKFNALLKVLSERQTLLPDTVAFLEQSLESIPIQKGSILIKEGDSCDCIYFIYEGAFRAFTHLEGKDITTWISIENDFITSITAYFSKGVAIKNLEAIEDGYLLALQRDDMYEMARRFPEFNNLLRMLYEEYYLAAEERAYIARISTAEGKYKRMLQIYPQLIKRLPLKYTASFLGMTLETLSRIRSRLSKQLA